MRRKNWPKLNHGCSTWTPKDRRTPWRRFLDLLRDAFNEACEVARRAWELIKPLVDLLMPPPRLIWDGITFNPDAVSQLALTSGTA
jgi:hypothetical protein